MTLDIKSRADWREFWTPPTAPRSHSGTLSYTKFRKMLSMPVPCILHGRKSFHFIRGIQLDWRMVSSPASAVSQTSRTSTILIEMLPHPPSTWTLTNACLEPRLRQRIRLGRPTVSLSCSIRQFNCVSEPKSEVAMPSWKLCKYLAPNRPKSSTKCRNARMQEGVQKSRCDSDCGA